MMPSMKKIGLLPTAMLILVIGLTLLEPRFWDGQNLLNVLRGGALLFIVAAGQMLVLIARGFDLSVGAVMALTSVVSTSVMVALTGTMGDGSIIVLGVLAGVGTGVIVGICNGICVAVLGITPFMVTLAMASIVTGVALLLTNGIPIYGFPAGFTTWGRTSWIGLPPAVYGAFVIGALLFAIQRYTPLGMHLYAIGGNTHASNLSGLHVKKYQVLVYVASAVLASLASLLLTAQLGSGQGSIGNAVALQSIGAAVIAGVSLQGGVGKVEQVALGALFLLVLNNAMDLLRIESKTQAIVMGLFIIVVVALDEYKKKVKIA